MSMLVGIPCLQSDGYSTNTVLFETKCYAYDVCIPGWASPVSILAHRAIQRVGSKGLCHSTDLWCITDLRTMKSISFAPTRKEALRKTTTRLTAVGETAYLLTQ